MRGLPALPHAVRWGAPSASFSGRNQQLESASLGLVRGLERVLHLSVGTWPGICLAVQSCTRDAAPRLSPMAASSSYPPFWSKANAMEPLASQCCSLCWLAASRSGSWLPFWEARSLGGSLGGTMSLADGAALKPFQGLAMCDLLAVKQLAT